jgi:hypothetical protein
VSAVRLGVADRRAVALAAAPLIDLNVTAATAGTTVTGTHEVTDLDTLVRIRLERTSLRSTAVYASHHITHELAHHRWQELSQQAQQARLVRVARAQRRARRAEQRANRAVQSARLASMAALRAAERLV